MRLEPAHGTRAFPAHFLSQPRRRLRLRRKRKAFWESSADTRLTEKHEKGGRNATARLRHNVVCAFPYEHQYMFWFSKLMLYYLRSQRLRAIRRRAGVSPPKSSRLQQQCDSNSPTAGDSRQWSAVSPLPVHALLSRRMNTASLARTHRPTARSGGASTRIFGVRLNRRAAARATQ